MIHIRLLGALDLTGHEGSPVLSVLSQPKRMGLLAFLVASHPHGFHSRDQLLALFWPEGNEERARNALRQSLHFLRRSLGDDAILSRGEEVGAAPSMFTCDVADFEDAIQNENWKEALELYGGPLLEGFHLSGSPGFDRWLEAERERLRLLAVRGGERLSAELEARGDLGGAVETARRVTELSPANGVAAERLIRILGKKGDRSGALRAYERFRARLWDDLELEPTEELQSTVAAIRQGAGLGVRGSTGSVSLGGAAEEGSEELSEPRTSRKGRTQLWETTDPPPAMEGTGGAPLPKGRPRRTRLTIPRIVLWVSVLVPTVAFTWWLSSVLIPGQGRIPIYLKTIELTRPDSMDFELRTILEDELRKAAGGSRRVRLVEPTEAFEFILGSEISTDSIGFSVEKTGSASDLSGSWSHLKPDSVSESEVASVAMEAVRKLEVAVAGDSDIPLTMSGTSNSDASDRYDYGRELWDLREPDLFPAALWWLQQAVELDPSYALAYAAIADVYNLLGAYDYGIMPPDSAYLIARQAAELAVELEPDLAQAQAALATTKFFYEWDFEGAKVLYESAVALDPTYLHARHWQALLQAAGDDLDEALESIDEAIEADSSEFILRSARGRILYFQGDYPKALSEYQKVLDREFDFMPARLGHALTAMMNGDYEDARTDLRLATSFFGPPTHPVVMGLEGYLLGLEGDTAGANRRLEELRALRDAGPPELFVPAEYLVMVHLGLKDYEAALDELNEAYDSRSSSMTILRVDPLLEPLRGMDRFQALLERVLEGSG